VGICDAASTCQPTPVTEGTVCNDFSTCTDGDVCSAGTCAGTPVAGCDFYFEDNFENGCPAVGWTLGGDWECGTPTGSGPGAAYDGAICLGTQIDGDYSDNQSYSVAFAQMPTIGLGAATEPVLEFAAWIQTEGCCDGVNLKVSTNGGATFSVLTSITPGYNLTISGEPAWGDTFTTGAWQIFTADLSTYAGQDILLRFSFQSDGSIVEPGIYVDDVVISEAQVFQLDISTPSTLPSAMVDSPYLLQMQKSGGSSGSVWSVVPGTNPAWLSLDPAGILSGTPTIADLGPFSITVRVEEPGLPSNFAEKVLTGDVVQGFFLEAFEGPCPSGWTLGGDWECGAPSGPGPGSAFDGANCLGTQIEGEYNNNQLYATATATSPPIDLTGALNPVLTFRMWVDTEGSTYDGANLKISTDGIAFTQVMNVNPAYPLPDVGGQPAWGGNQAALGWQLVTVDLTAYAGQTITLRYAFQTDGSITFPGVYIDSLFIQ
jgi:hypothetical protein